MEQEKITALLVKPGEVPQIVEIEPRLKNLQDAVGGLIEDFEPFADNVVIICNEEGKIAGLPLNRTVRDENGITLDVIAGPFLVVGENSQTLDHCSLSPEQVKKYEKMFHQPETFDQNEQEKIAALLVKPGEVPQIVEIDNDWKSFKDVLGCNYTDKHYIGDGCVWIIYNPEGRIGGLPLNRVLRDNYGIINRVINHVIAGSFLVVGIEECGGEYLSLSSEQVEKYEKMFHQPETFDRNEQEKITALLIKPDEVPKIVEIDNDIKLFDHTLCTSIGDGVEIMVNMGNGNIVEYGECTEGGEPPLNRALRDKNGKIDDVIAGPFLIVGKKDPFLDVGVNCVTMDYYCSLSPEQVEKYEKMFHQPESFVRYGRSIKATPIPDDMVKTT